MRRNLGLCVVICLSGLVVGKDLAAQEREGKVFSLFSVVQFKNEPCSTSEKSTSSSSGSKHGTCYTSSECENKGGSAKGNCAAGFGVCCLFQLAKVGEVNQNCTYVQNPGYPSAYAETSAVKYTIKKCTDEVCSVRLDFENFDIGGVANTEEKTGGECATDKLAITTTAGGAIPVICGKNSGQHVYINMGSGSSDTATLDFSFTGVNSARAWEVKVTQLPCNHPNSPPSGCLQYHTATSGRFETFNFPSTGSTLGHLQNQDYSVCIRQNDGYCCVQYQPCADITGMAAFSIDNIAMMGTKAKIDSLCEKDYIVIPGSSATCNAAGNLHNRYCSLSLNPVKDEEMSVPICDCTAPFEVRIKTDADGDDAMMANAMMANAMESRGVCLQYNQVAC